MITTSNKILNINSTLDPLPPPIDSQRIMKFLNSTRQRMKKTEKPFFGDEMNPFPDNIYTKEIIIIFKITLTMQR